MNARPRPTERSDMAAAMRNAPVQARLDEAKTRDEQADLRDSIAAERDRAAELKAFLDPSADYDAALRGRHAAALDRADARRDRLSAADDRSMLAPEHDSPEPRKEKGPWQGIAVGLSEPISGSRTPSHARRRPPRR
jgi:hypothetical protein